MRTADIRVRRAIAAVGQAVPSSSRTARTSERTGIPGASPPRPRRPTCSPSPSGIPRDTSASPCRARMRPADLPPMCHRAADWAAPRSGGGRLVRRRHRHLGDRSRQHHRGARCGNLRRPPTSGARVTSCRCGPATTGCWDCRRRPRRRWILPGLRAGDRQRALVRDRLSASASVRWPMAPSWSSSPTGTPTEPGLDRRPRGVSPAHRATGRPVGRDDDCP